MTDDNSFRRLWNLGYHRLTPITPPGCPVSERSSFHKRIAAGDDARGKAPGVRWPDGTWSGFDFVAHESTEADLDKWHAMGAGVGVKVGAGLVLIDADTLNEDHARIVKQEIERICGPLPVRVGKYPKAGYLCRTAEDFQYTRIEFGERDAKGRLKDRVEILSEGRQFVAVGIHPATMKPYRWPHGMPARSDLPFVEPEKLLAVLKALRPLLPAASDVKVEGAPTEVDQSALRGDMALVAKAVAATPNTSAAFPTRDDYRNYGYAIKAAAGPDNEAEAFELYADWCARWEDGDNPADVVAADWKRMKPPFRRGASWLYELAETHGGGTFSAAERWFDADAGKGDGESLFPVEQPAQTKRFAFTAFDDAAATALTTAAAPLIKGILDQGAMTVLYGESNAGKTFVAMDISYHIATGRPWAGKRTAAFPVLYIAAEGGQGARKRAAALASRYGATSAFWFLMHPVNLLRADADLKPLLASIEAVGLRFGLIVVDTLSRAMAGGDENASTDMGAMVKHLDALRSATGAHLMVVHHSGKDRAKGARGHSLLRAATDTEIEVVDGEIVVTKQRDLEGSFASGFALDVVTLGVDAEGDPVTSCTIRLVRREDVSVVVGNATPRERDVLVAVSELEAFNTGSQEGISAEDVAQYFENRSDEMSVNGARVMLKKLVSKNCITKTGRGKWSITEIGRKSLVVQSGPEVVQGVFE